MAEPRTCWVEIDQLESSFTKKPSLCSKQTTCVKLHSVNERGQKLSRPSLLNKKKGTTIWDAKRGAESVCKETSQTVRQSGILNNSQDSSTGEKTYECTKTHKNFSGGSAHGKRAPSLGNVFRGNKCGDVSHQSLKDLQSSHLQDEAYKCEGCVLTFRQKSDLLEHQKTHGRAKSYKCGECGKAFSSCSDLNVHQRSHDGENPHECKECGRAFASGRALARHQHTHTGKKSYICEECGKNFKKGSNLNQHLRIHTGEKPFKCEDCGLAFNQSSHLAKHQRIYAGECGRSIPPVLPAFSLGSGI